MFIFTLEPFVDSAVAAIQYATTFKLAKDEEFKDIVHEVRVDKPDDIYKFVYEPILDPDINYYIKARRHFNESNLDHDTPVKIVRHDKGRSEALIYNRDNRIETPWIYVNGDDIIDHSKTEFTIKTSKFKANMAGHESTTWIIRDGTGVVVFASVEDKKNKTSITINKTLDITTKSKLTISVIHRSAVGIESDVAEVHLVLQRFNFEVVSDVSNIQAAKNYTLTLKRTNPNAKMNIYKIEAIHPTTKEILWGMENNSEGPRLDFIIPWHLFKPNTLVRLIITALDTDKDMGHKIIELYTGIRYIQYIEDFGYKYKNVMNRAITPPYNNQCNGVTTVEIPEGYIPMPVRSSKFLYKFKYNSDTGVLSNTNEVLKGITLLDNENDDIFIQYTENNLLVVDTWRDMGGTERRPVFLVYRHDLHSDTYDLISMVSHPNGDTHTAATTGAFTQLTASTFIYMPPDAKHLYEIDIATNKCNELIQLPHDVASHDIDRKWFMRMPKQRIYIQCSDETITYKYEILKQKFEHSINVNPQSFTKTHTYARMLPNGNNLIFKTKHYPGDTDGGAIIYNYADREFQPVDIIFQPGEYPQGSILLLDNSVLLSRAVRDTVSGDTDFYLYKYV